MPYRNGTGPQGLGMRTGRGLGPCGSGMRRGLGYREQIPLTKSEEKKVLEEQLKAIQERLKELD
jgi:hypothetical protein